jgi:hypothetical protein
MEAGILEALRVPALGQLVDARRRYWVVADISRGRPLNGYPRNRTRARQSVTPTSVEGDRDEDSIRVISGLEPGTRILDEATLPTPNRDRLMTSKDWQHSLMLSVGVRSNSKSRRTEGSDQI